MAKIDSREAELRELAASLGERDAESERKHASLVVAQQECELKMRELDTAKEQLASLRQQLEAELSQLADQNSDLLPRYGLTAEDGASGQKADGQLPKPADAKARASLERFQKLCRDAKRKAIGAG